MFYTNIIYVIVSMMSKHKLSVEEKAQVSLGVLS